MRNPPAPFMRSEMMIQAELCAATEVHQPADMALANPILFLYLTFKM